MMRPSDPRVIATYNRLATSLESANQTTQSYLYGASQRAEPYVSSCLASLSTCLEASCQPCFNLRDEHFRRRGYHHQASRAAGVRRGREALGFDFYDDWEQEEAEWANDELERLLSGGGEEDVGAGSGGIGGAVAGGGGGQPGKHPKMTYGTRLGGRVVGKRKEVADDPNVVPQSSMFGFLERLPWKIGGRGSGRYRPSVADLQEGIGRRGTAEAEQALLGEEDEESGRKTKGRGRSGTAASRSSTNSLSSRGDLFPSDDEDAVPIDDDEFAMALERRPTGATTSDDHSSRKKRGNGPALSRSSTKTGSSRNSPRKSKRDASASSGNVSQLAEGIGSEVPSMTDLKLEEERVREEEEAQLEKNRQTAQKLAAQRGLSGNDMQDADVNYLFRESF